MKLSVLLTLSALVGCGAGLPSAGWYINGSQNDQAACFEDPAGVSAWNHCSVLSGDKRSTCQVETLLTYRGTVVSEHTAVSVYQHSAHGESKVLLGKTDVFCSTVRVRVGSN